MWAMGRPSPPPGLDRSKGPLWDYLSAVEIDDLKKKAGIAAVKTGSLTEAALRHAGVPVADTVSTPSPAKTLESRTLSSAERKGRFWWRFMVPVTAAFLACAPVIAIIMIIMDHFDGGVERSAGNIETDIIIVFYGSMGLFILLIPLWVREYRRRVNVPESACLTIRLDGAGLVVRDACRPVLSGSWADLSVVDLQLLEQVVEGGRSVGIVGVTLEDAAGCRLSIMEFTFEAGMSVVKVILRALHGHGRLTTRG